MFSFFKTGYQKIQKALSKSRSLLGGKIRSLFGKPWDEETLESLEQILYEADLGPACVETFLTHLRSKFRFSHDVSLEEILGELKLTALSILKEPTKVNPKEGHPLVFLVVGINGSGKTTSLAKLGLHFQKIGKKVLFGAADTFRAAAIEQLSLWAERLGADIVKGAPGSDPSAVAFDALSAAKARGTDIVLLDTAGRLHNKTDLMHELEKTKKTCDKVLPGAPHEILLVLDATTGQNALDQARIFHHYVPLTGIILTKLDGSAKGGILFALYQELGIPVRYIGVGEQAEDLIPFDPESYVNSLFASD